MEKREYMNSSNELIEDIKNGKMVILVDDEDRENEGDLVVAADHITPEMINFMAREARGLICLALTPKQISRLGIPLMVKEDNNFSPNKTAFTVSIEAADGVSTGISAADRAHTCKVAADPKSTSESIIVPGHVFPIRSQFGGVLKRAGHTEGSVDLCALAGLNPAAVICEIMNTDGSMARLSDLKEFAQKHQLKIGTIEDLIEYRIENESFVEEVASSPIDTKYGEGFTAHIFKNNLDGREHIALVKGEINSELSELVRVQTENPLGDVFGCIRLPSGESIRKSMEIINKVGHGIMLYLRLDGRQGPLSNKVKNYYTPKSENDDLPEEKRLMEDRKDYGVGAQILRALGVRKINLLTNRPSKRVGLKGYGLEIVDTVPLNESETI